MPLRGLSLVCFAIRISSITLTLVIHLLISRLVLFIKCFKAVLFYLSKQLCNVSTLLFR